MRMSHTHITTLLHADFRARLQAVRSALPERNSAMTNVRVGLVGCGFVAELHMYAYKRVYGLDAQLTAVAARGDHVRDFAKKHQIRRTHRDFKSLLADKEIDVVDICTAPALHAAMIVEAMQAGNTSFARSRSPDISDAATTRPRSASTYRNRSCTSASWRRWTRFAPPSNPAAGFSCTQKIESMRRP